MDFSKKFVCEGLEYSSFQKKVPAPLFRKSFFLEQMPDEAEILICGLGFYDLFVNGEKITKGHLAPYISNPDHILYYDAYDLKPYLHAGENVIGVMLGDGFLVGKTYTWNFIDNATNAAPMVALSVQIKCAGSWLRFEADSFVCKKGPVTFNDLRAGVHYDARLEEKGWCSPGYAEKDWHIPLKAAAPKGYAKLCEAEPVRIYREIRPVQVQKGGMVPYKGILWETYQKEQLIEKAPAAEGGYIYDFGENNAGIFRLKIRGTRGQRVDIQCAEQVVDGKIFIEPMNFYPEGFCQRDIYILSGDGEEFFEPMFTFHGFRYLYVTGITEEQATPDLLTFLVMSSDLEERGTFSCSDETANTIYQMARRSDISNFFYFPLDCPHREKNGWTGDASLSAEHMIMTIGAENSWREWLHNIRAAQKPEGDIPGIVPTGEWGYGKYSGVAWDNVLFNLPYFVYQYRGETQIIQENTAAMMRYLDFLSKTRDEEGIVRHKGLLGDWCPVGKIYPDADLCYLNTVLGTDVCSKAEKMFRAVDLDTQADFAEQLGRELRKSARAKYIDPATCRVKDGCQTSQALALFYNIFTEAEEDKGFRVLMDILKEDHYKLTCGVVGARVLFHVLSQFGQTELAYEMITTKDFPGYGYWAAKGETTLLESFHEYDDTTPYASSKNHHFWGDVVNWFMSRVGGLQVVSHNHVKVDPFFVKRLDWCRTTHKLPDGEIKISWERQNNKIQLCVECRGNVTWELAGKENYIQQNTDSFLIIEGEANEKI